jgi:hypothetical protein
MHNPGHFLLPRNMEKSLSKAGRKTGGLKGQYANISVKRSYNTPSGRREGSCVNAGSESDHAAAAGFWRLISTVYSHSLSAAV